MSQTAIVAYINLLSDTKIHNIQDLSSGEIFCQIASLIQPSKIDLSKVLFADDWIPKLSNLKLFLKHLQMYNQEELGHKLQTHEVDLLKIAKHQSKHEIHVLFEILLGVLMNCHNKQNFIKLILEMDEHSQHQLTNIVKKVMVQPVGEQVSSHNQSAALLQKLDELEHELDGAKRDNSKLKDILLDHEKQNKLLHEQVAKLSRTITNLNSEISEKQSKTHPSDFYDNSLVESLKHKLISESVEHQTEKMKMNQQIELMRTKLERIDFLENKTESFQQKIALLNDQVSELQDDLSHANEQITRKKQNVKKLEEMLRSLSEKSNKEELERISLQVDAEKKNLRDEFRKTVETRSSDPLLEQYSHHRESQQQLSIATRRIKTLEKELAKTNLKAEKATKLETEKKELQQTFIIELNNKKQQIEILASALIEIRLQQLNHS